jgi:hypothetical protein
MPIGGCMGRMGHRPVDTRIAVDVVESMCM